MATLSEAQYMTRTPRGLSHTSTRTIAPITTFSKIDTTVITVLIRSNGISGPTAAIRTRRSPHNCHNRWLAKGLDAEFRL